MKSVRTIYKTGMGPSSSHTMGPAFAAKTFKDTHPEADRFTVILYGSLAKTGKGHGTDRAIEGTLSPIPAEIIFNTDDTVAASLPHPNTLDFVGYAGDIEIGRMRFLSVGGGEVRMDGEEAHAPDLDITGVADEVQGIGVGEGGGYLVVEVEDDLGGDGGEGIGDGTVGAVTLARLGQGAVEDGLKAVGLGVGVLEGLGGEGGTHGMGA